VAGKLKFQEEIINLDSCDRKILSALSKDASLSFSQISRKIKMSKHKVINRAKKLEDKKAILGYQAYINPFRLNLSIGILYITTNDTQKQALEYIERCSKIPLVISSIQITGNHNIIIAFYFKNQQSRENSLTKLLSYNKILDWDLIETESAYFPILDISEINEKNYKFRIEEEPKSKIKLDKLDIKILKQLVNNCRTPIKNFPANKSASTIISRIKRLEKNKIIEKYQAITNIFALGYSGYLLKLKIKKPINKKEIIQFLGNTKKSNGIYSTKGSWNLIAFMHFKNTKELQTFEEDLLNQFETSISKHSFELINYQSKLDWFPKELSETLINQNPPKLIWEK